MSKSSLPESNPFYGNHFISVRQEKEDGSYLLDRDTWNWFVSQTLFMKDAVERNERLDLLEGIMTAILFYQPSTRTFSSFKAAAEWMGGMTFANQGMKEYSSAYKGENIPDTVRSIAATTAASAIVLRHPSNNSSEVAAKFSPVPVINAGSGTLEHPTQALLDLLTIQSKMNTIDNLNVAFVGDLLFGRTVKSLAWLLAQTGQKNKLAFVSAPELAIPTDYLDSLPEGTKVSEFQDLLDVLTWADVIYMTRTQKEWFEQNGMIEEYEKLGSALKLTREDALQMKDNSVIMHPLPRQEELRYGVDENPRAAYFEQMRYGLYARMALLASILKK